jgi:ATP-binding cassette subfamily C (CFTR/MRP) protein 1
VVKQASKTGEIDIHDLPLPSQQQAEVAYDEFNTNWEAAVKAGNPNLRKVLMRTFGKDMFLAGLWKLLWSIW